MSTQMTGNLCTMVEQDGHIECSGFPAITSATSSVVTPVIAVVPPTGPPGRTTFTLTYQNLADPYVDSTRYGQLQGYINDLLGSFASTLGNARDTSNAANAINVNVDVNLASLSQAFLITVLYGGPPENVAPYYQGTCWRIRITKYYSPGVIVLEAPMNLFTDPNIWPSYASPSLQALSLNYDTTTKEVSFSNVASLFLTPAAWLTLSSSFANTQFYWNYILPSGSTATPLPLEFTVNGSPLAFNSPAQASPSVSAFFISASTISLGITTSNIGLNILAQAGPRTVNYYPTSQSQTTLWDPTGVPLPNPSTPFTSITSFGAPLVTSSQWRFLRVLPDWLAPSAAAIRASLDSGLPSSALDIEVTINSDSNRLQSSFYDFSDSYIVSNPALYCFKAVLVHEMIHGFGFLDGLSVNGPSGTQVVSFFNHYAFANSNLPANAAEFQTKLRSIGNVNWVSNGVSVNAPIEPTSTSHLLLTSFSQNGLMEPILNPGSITPNGTGPLGGPSKNDLDVLLCCSILSQEETVCVKEDTLVLTMSGEKRIDQIVQGDLVQNYQGAWVSVMQCIEVASCREFVLIPQGVLGEEIPNKDIYIRKGHPILINGQEVECDRLIGTTRPGCGMVRQESFGKGRVSVYTLVTEDRTFVNMQGLLVGTWSQASWENYRLNDSHSHFNAFCH